MVTALGHAGLRVDGAGRRVLLDPWLSPRGAFLGSWFPFPDNSHLAGPWLRAADVVVVSHEHPDHLDLDFLATLPPAVPVIVPRHPSTRLERRLRARGRTARALDAWERFPLGADAWLTVIPEECPMRQGAAVLLVVADRALLHVNHARISPAQARRAAAEAGRPIDLMAVQISSAQRTRTFRAVTELVRAVGPRLVLPYAGAPCFLDDELFELNAGLHGVLPDQALARLAAGLPAQPGAHLLPGDMVELDELRIARDAHWDDVALDANPEERRRYLEEYAERRRPFLEDVLASHPEPAADDGLAERFRAHVEALGALATYFPARIGRVLRFEVLGAAGGTWDVHLGPDDVRVDLDGGGCRADHRLRLEARWLVPVVEGRTSWEELLLSRRCSARRADDLDRKEDADDACAYLVALLGHADPAALRAVEECACDHDPACVNADRGPDGAARRDPVDAG